MQNDKLDELVAKLRETKQVYNNDFPGHDTFWKLSREEAAQAIRQWIEDGLLEEYQSKTGGYLPRYKRGYNQAISDMRENLKLMEDKGNA